MLYIFDTVNSKYDIFKKTINDKVVFFNLTIFTNLC